MPPADSAAETQTPLRLAVIGGGITGLSAALRLWDLSQGVGEGSDLHRLVQIVLLESSSRLGGVFGSQQVEDFLIERGADSFITNKPQGLELCRRLAIDDRLIPTSAQHRGSLILHRGKPVPTPAGFQLLAPSRLWPMLTTPLLSWKGKLRLLREPWLPARLDQDDESVAAFVRRRFGNELLDNIAQPLVGGIYTSDPERLSLQATLPRFREMEHRHGSLTRALRHQSARGEEQSASGARYGLFTSFPQGMQELLDALERELAGKVDVRLNEGVEKLTRLSSTRPTATSGEEPQCWRLRTTRGVQLEVDGIVLALPPHAAGAVLQNVDAECSQQLAAIESASSAIVITGHNEADIKHPLNAFGLVIPHRERRRILAVSFLSRKFPNRAPAGKVILRTFIGGALQPEEYQKSDKEIATTVLSELRDLLGVGGTPEFSIVARYPQGMPQYTLGHLERVREIHSRVASIPQLELAGNAYAGVGLPDCIDNGQQAAERLWQSLQFPPPP